MQKLTKQDFATIKKAIIDFNSLDEPEQLMIFGGNFIMNTLPFAKKILTGLKCMTTLKIMNW